ncbi:MAG: tetratricopeptide repeat protein [Acidobacteriota bacterium]|nr:tetratricopeptide repeat protein [Acidobacteriota bacterium]
MPPAIESGLRPSNRWLHAATAGLLALSIGVQVARDLGWQPYQPTTPVLWFQSGALLKKISLGFDNLLADIYWMRAVVYYGSQRRADESDRNFDLLDPLLTLVTTLDPQFKVAYRFGAIFLTEAYPSGPGRPDRAIALLERGLAANPNGWEYLHDIGFVHYWWLHDYRLAAEWFEKAGQLPRAPEWLAPLAASTLAQGGDRQSSRFLWRQLFESSDADWLKRNAQRSLFQLDAMDVIDQLNLVSQRFTRREGRPPTGRELILEAGLRGAPLDPTGVPYVTDPATGRVTVSKKSVLWPLPTEPAVQPPAPK